MIVRAKTPLFAYIHKIYAQSGRKEVDGRDGLGKQERGEDEKERALF